MFLQNHTQRSGDMRKHLRGNRGTRWLAILLTAAMVVGSVDATVLAEAAKGAEEQTLPVAEAGTSGDAKDKEETPAVKTETSEEVKNPEAAENAQSGKDANAPETSGNAQTGKDANAPETSGNAEEAGAVADSTSENGAGGGVIRASGSAGRSGASNGDRRAGIGVFGRVE